MTEAQKSLHYWYGNDKKCEPSGKNHTWVWVSLFIAMLVGCVVLFNMNHLQREFVLDVAMLLVGCSFLFLLLLPGVSNDTTSNDTKKKEMTAAEVSKARANAKQAEESLLTLGLLLIIPGGIIPAVLYLCYHGLRD